MSLLYDSVEILALPFVTLTPNSFARATISIRLRAETACAILQHPVSIYRLPSKRHLDVGAGAYSAA